ncbi:MAG: uracil-DNA glycosylase [Rickettsiales bacterium]
MNKKALLEWQFEAGIDEAVDELPNNYFNISKSKSVNSSKPQKLSESNDNSKVLGKQHNAPVNNSSGTSSTLHLSPTNAENEAVAIAGNCNSISELKEAIDKFEGCQLKRTATNTVFADGNPNAKIMVIGDIAGDEDDMVGTPFLGKSGKMFDKMLMSIGLDRGNTYLTNIIFWRPPGGKQANPEQIKICLPFTRRHIELVKPEFIILLGGTSACALLETEQTVAKLRGKIHEYSYNNLDIKIKSSVIHHPSYLHNNPSYKKQVWNDLLLINDILR